MVSLWTAVLYVKCWIINNCYASFVENITTTDATTTATILLLIQKQLFLTVIIQL